MSGGYRALFVDVSLVLVLSTNLPPIQSAKARKLKMQDPRFVKNTISVLNIFQTP